MVRVPGVFVLSAANEHATAAWDGASDAATDSDGACETAVDAAGEAAPFEQAAAKTATIARAATPFTMRMGMGSPTGWCAADCTARRRALPERQPETAGVRASSSGRMVTGVPPARPSVSAALPRLTPMHARPYESSYR